MGGCSVAQPIPFLERFLALFGPQAVRFIAMDREFGAKAWLEWLQAHGLSFRLRLCAEHRLSNARGEPTPVRQLCAHLAPGQAERWGPRHLWGVEVEVAVLRLPPRQGRRAKSLFRYGLDYLCHLLAPGAAADPLRQEHFRQLLQLLSCA